MARKDPNVPRTPQSIGEILPDVLDKIEDRMRPVLPRTTDEMIADDEKELDFLRHELMQAILAGSGVKIEETTKT